MGVKTCLWLELEYNTDQVKFAAKNVKAKFIACEISVKRVCICSMFCCTLRYVLSSIAIIDQSIRAIVVRYGTWFVWVLRHFSTGLIRPCVILALCLR